jgi:cytochrome c oxidase cbb3-type subunit 3
VLFPAVPGIVGYTEGVLGYNQRVELDDALAEARAAQAAQLDRIAAAPLEEIAADPQLLAFAGAGGRSVFGENCAACHGLGGAGRPGGFPVLADDDWLWGGTLAEIHATIANGVRQEREGSRSGEMLAFGADGILDAAQIDDVAEFVLSLSAAPTDPEAAARGAVVFEENCAGCHGADGEGGREFGAPRLNDAIWLYQGDKAAIVRQVTRPSHGRMPAWSERLSPETIKMLAIYVHGLGGGE